MKRKRQDSGKDYRGGKRSRVSNARVGYATVPRTRGVYAKGEMKYNDTYVNSTVLAAATDWTGTEMDPATLNTLFVPQLGTGINQRIGQKVSVVKQVIRGQVFAPILTNQTASHQNPVVRLIHFMDEQTNSTQAQGEDLMSAPSANATSAPFGFQNVNNFGRFKVLKDKMRTLPVGNISYDGTNIEQGGVAIPFKFTFKPKKPVVMQFNATNGGTVADIVNNSFHLLAITSSTGITPQISYVCRTYYKD